MKNLTRYFKCLHPFKWMVILKLDFSQCIGNCVVSHLFLSNSQCDANPVTFEMVMNVKNYKFICLYVFSWFGRISMGKSQFDMNLNPSISCLCIDKQMVQKEITNCFRVVATYLLICIKFVWFSSNQCPKISWSTKCIEYQQTRTSMYPEITIETTEKNISK